MHLTHWARELIDHVVHRGRAVSRAAVIARAHDRERRREIAERDATILVSTVGDPTWTSWQHLRQPRP